MRKYELVVLINPTLETDKATAVSDNVVKLIVDNGGKAEAKNTLESTVVTPYEVKKHNSAYKQVIEFEVAPDAITEIERNLRINEDVIRYMTIKIDEKKIARAEARKEAKKNIKPRRNEFSSRDSKYSNVRNSRDSRDYRDSRDSRDYRDSRDSSETKSEDNVEN